jgi:carboxypeptidase family protein
VALLKRVVFAAVLLIVVMPGAALADSIITGVVTDTSGAVVPGVTVEASSPALIEQTRSVVTDSNGVYRIVDLRPGPYKVTFTLTGFSTVVRDGIILETDFTATINAQLRVGSVEESITVSGASPVVDVQNTQSRAVISSEQIEQLPSGRSFQSLSATVPALQPSGSGRFDVGGASQMWQGTVSAYGSLANDTSLQVDGMSVMTLLNQGSISGVYHNQGAYQEMSYQVVAGSAESQTGGVLINMIPKEGGNRVTFDGVALYTNKDLQSSNNQGTGLANPSSLYNLYDYNATIGGPVMKDRLWFLFSTRQWGGKNYIANQKFADGSPAIDNSQQHAYTTRLTSQLNPKNRLTVMYDYLPKYRQYFGSETGVLAPSGAALEGHGQGKPQIGYDYQAKWTGTLTNKLLLETGFSQNFLGFELIPQDGVALPSAANPFGDISKTDLSIATKGAYNAPSTYFYYPFVAKTFVTSMSYVTGSHAFKVGLQDKWGRIKETLTNNGNMVQVYNNGLPLQVRVYNTPVATDASLNDDFGFYVQDSWRISRLTVNPGLRWEQLREEVNAQAAPAGRFVGPRSFDAIENLPNFKNFVPRVGAAYDLFGNGTTGIKGSVGRYMQQDASSFATTYNPMVTSLASLSWTDLNGDDIAEGSLGCVYQTPGCEINFAQMPTTFGVRRNRNPDPNLSRPYQILYNIGFTHELKPGLGFAVNYYRREFHAVTYTTNLANPVANYTAFNIPDPRNNGQTIAVYNANPSTLPLINELDTTSPNNKTTFNGVDVGLTARFRNVNLSGGTSTGRTISILCDVEDPNYNSAAAAGVRFCDQSQYSIPWLTTVKASGSVLLPAQVRISAVLQSSPGDPITQTYVITAAAFRAATGVALSQSSLTARLTQPGTLYEPRVNQLDVTFTRPVKMNHVAISPEVSVFNAFNANPVLTQSVAYPNVGIPLTILNGRTVRFGVTVRY